MSALYTDAFASEFRPSLLFKRRRRDTEAAGATRARRFFFDAMLYSHCVYAHRAATDSVTDS